MLMVCLWEALNYCLKFVFHNPTYFIAAASFLWYRSGRLWKFYYSMLDEAIKQSKTASIMRDQWKEIAKRYIDLLVSDYFGALLRCEIEFLRDLINESIDEFVIPDSSTNSHPEMGADLNAKQVVTSTTYHNNKGAHAEYWMRMLYYRRFRWGGARLLLASIKHSLTKRYDPGFKTTTMHNPISEYLKELDAARQFMGTAKQD